MNVTIRKLDTIFQHGVAASHMMKVDVQGFEVCAPETQVSRILTHVSSSYPIRTHLHSDHHYLLARAV